MAVEGTSQLASTARPLSPQDNVNLRTRSLVAAKNVAPSVYLQVDDSSISCEIASYSLTQLGYRDIILRDDAAQALQVCCAPALWLFVRTHTQPLNSVLLS